MPLKTAVILAAGMGIRLSPIVGIHPKGLLQIGELPLLGRSLNFLKKNGFEKILIVVGHQSQELKKELEKYTNCFNTQFVFNERYAETGSMHSLFMLHEILDDDFLGTPGFKHWILRDDRAARRGGPRRRLRTAGLGPRTSARRRGGGPSRSCSR